MIEQDTIKLLKECDAGIDMGITSIGDVLQFVSDTDLKAELENSKKEHERLEGEIASLLDRYNEEGKAPNPMAKGMSWLKTNVKLTIDESDQTVADLITDGCNMGVKTLSKYLNQYKAADEKSKDITKKLINAEEKLAFGIRKYL